MITLFELIYVVEDRGEEIPVFSRQEDRARLKALAAGDRAAFDWFFAENREPLYRFVFRYMKEEEVSLDIVQESFVRFLSMRERIDEKKGVRSYLYTIALHCCYDELRKKKKRRMESLDKMVDVHGVTVEDKRNRFEHKELLREVEERIEQIIETLPQPQRDALMLKRINAFTYEDISQMLGYSLRHSKKLVRQALDKIVATLDKEGLTEKGELRI